ncbi:hypothetical protein NMY3_03370 [Candidatus Nitrosocosmicus oleophilus]|uniref:Uncharacterized protein n=2 Tax=Candidatus Nitrosocosmicus oleophilus TaxID=1353260 RepID=A0A654M4B4_9ARCH|nr:hypothetical protein NMY3_03370 [Candidatus Nitrosocosmicus oleophilus]
MDSMTIKNYNKFDGYNFFAVFSISLLILALFTLTLSNVFANLDTNSTLLTDSNSTLLTDSNSTLLTDSNSTENNINGTISSFPGSLDSDRRHMPVL